MWPQDNALRDNIRAEYVIQSNLYEPALLLAVVSDTQALNQQLQRTRYVVMFGAGLVTLCAVLLALYIFQRSTLKPLGALTRQLRLVQKDRSHLGEQVDVSGNAELQELATNFNEMTTELKTLYSSLENMAFTDPLTNLPNRTLFHDRMAQLVGLCQSTKVKFAVFMIDLDRFKEVNDTLGHQVGDLLLQQVAARLENVLRRADSVARLGGETVARLGGDEFAAILPTIAIERDAMNVAQRIQFTMERPMLVAEHSLTISISVGIVIYPIHGSEGSTLLQRADIAMYQAKHNHQGFVFYDAKQDHHSLSQLTMISDLRKAMEKNQLLMHFQPKIDIRTGRLCGAEALVRWQHPERGFMPPDSFIPVAELKRFYRAAHRVGLERINQGMRTMASARRAYPGRRQPIGAQPARSENYRRNFENTAPLRFEAQRADYRADRNCGDDRLQSRVEHLAGAGTGRRKNLGRRLRYRLLVTGESEKALGARNKN